MMPNDFNKMEDHDPTDVGRFTGWLIGMFALIAVLAIVDIVADFREGTDLVHIAVEMAVAGLAIFGVGLLGRQLVRSIRDSATATAHAAELEIALERTRAESERWRANAQDLMRGLGEAIEEQFDRWELSPAEAEVALLLLKGLSHKEVAQVRGITVTTARQQAAAVYKKAGLGGKQELLAFFLEDLILPSVGDAGDR